LERLGVADLPAMRILLKVGDLTSILTLVVHEKLLKAEAML
jgi:hypothetical protein